MAFGLKRNDLTLWKQQVMSGNIAFLTHYWYDCRFPQYKTVTKVGCNDIEKLIRWGKKYGLKSEWVDQRGMFPHFDLMGEREVEILTAEGYQEQLFKFRLGDDHDK